MTDAIIEAAARALRDCDTLHWDETPDWYYKTARHVLAAVTPLIRTAVLEEAAQVAEQEAKNTSFNIAAKAAEEIAAAIRALKEQP